MLDVALKSSAFDRIQPVSFRQKLGMDWKQLVRLRGPVTEDEQHRREVIGRLFALLTATFEDGAELALRGQDPGSTEHREFALSLLDRANEITSIAEALLLVLAPANS